MPAQIIVMTRTRISICLLSGLLLTGCSTVTVPDSAEIYYESAESTHTCYLKFETPTSGTATKEGYGEGSDYKQRNMRFSIR